jgi:hypothetical protein
LKKHFVIFLLFSLSFFELKAQGSIYITESLSTRLDNRYGPFHQTIKDTTKRTLSNFGHYFSVGLGSGNDYGIGGVISLISYSLAYKSLLFSLTRGGGGSIFVGGGDNSVYYNANYIGFLIGESVRFKHAMFSISAGIASSNIEVRYLDINANVPNHYIDSVRTGIVSIPIEIKVFFLARKGIGIGLHLSKNLVSPAKFSPFCFGVSLVFGKWNTKSNKVDNAFYKESVR